MVDSGTQVAVPTNLDVSLLSRLASVTDPVVESTLVSSSHALTSNTATPVVTDVARGSKNTDVFPSTRVDLDEDTTDFVSGLRSLVSPNVPTDHPFFRCEVWQGDSRGEGGLKR